MVNDWEEVTLGDTLTLQRGFDLSKANRVEGHIPIVASNGIVDWHDEFKVKAPGVVIGRSGSIGGGQYIEEDFWPLNTTLWVKDFKGNNERFCYYLLLNIDFQMFNVGSGVPTLNRNHIHPLPISLPPLAEQKAIAHILGSLDDKIELNRRMNETLEAMAQALFKSWFVDFDPVIDNALAAGNTIPDEFIERAEQRKAIEKKDHSDTQNLFPDEFEFSEEMGWIPKGWVNEPLSSFIEKSNTGADAIQKAPIVDYDTGIKCARIGDFSNNRDIASWGFSNVTAENFEKFKLLKGDILITRTSILGLSKIILEDLSAVYNNGLIRIRVNTNPIYVYQAFQTKEFRTYIDRITGESSTRPNMKISYLLEYPLLHPSTKLLKKASNIFSDSLVKRKELDLQVEIISKLRDTLLPKLISGELRISDAAELVSEVL